MTEPVLEGRGIVKRFGHVEALRGADFAVFPGEIVSLIGDNGAGKSTLVKVLVGTMQPDGGELLIDGHPTQFPTPMAAQKLGIETVYQDLALAPTLGPAANLFIGRELVLPGLLGRLGFLDKRAMRDRSVSILANLGVTLKDIDAPVSDLSGGQRQSVAISRAATWAKRVLFLDEPTAALGVVQTQRVLELIQRIRDTGVAVVLISHNIPQVIQVSDRIEVLRLGKRTARFTGHDVTAEELVGAMTGALIQGGAR